MTAPHAVEAPGLAVDPRILDCGHTVAQHGQMSCIRVREIEDRIAATPPTWRERLHRRRNERGAGRV